MVEQDTKARILKAAEAVVGRQGSKAMTLEAVAKEAGVSKGGMLYHFPNKTALIAAMVGQAISEFEAALSTAERASGDWLEGYLDATFADLERVDSLSGILAAVAEEPELLKPFQAALDRWYKKAESDYGATAIPLLLALDALWLHVLLGTLPTFPLVELQQILRNQAHECQNLRRNR